jgi:hypothetical protein
MTLILILQIIIVFILIYLVTQGSRETIYIHKPNAFSKYIPPDKCVPEDNCFPGTYNRTEVYNNICSPDEPHKLNRLPVELRDKCARKL